MNGYMIFAADGAVLHERLQHDEAIRKAKFESERAQEKIYIAKIVYEVIPNNIAIVRSV